MVAAFAGRGHQAHWGSWAVEFLAVFEVFSSPLQASKSLILLPCRFVPKFRKTLDFLLDGKHETHKIYEELIKVSSSQLSELKEIQTTGCENIIEAFLLEREKRKDSPDLNNFYNDQQFYHLLADMFGAGLDTTLTTLRFANIQNNSFRLLMVTNLQMVLVVHGYKQGFSTKATRRT